MPKTFTQCCNWWPEHYGDIYLYRRLLCSYLMTANLHLGKILRWTCSPVQFTTLWIKTILRHIMQDKRNSILWCLWRNIIYNPTFCQEEQVQWIEWGTFSFHMFQWRTVFMSEIKCHNSLVHWPVGTGRQNSLIMEVEIHSGVKRTVYISGLGGKLKKTGMIGRAMLLCFGFVRKMLVYNM